MLCTARKTIFSFSKFFERWSFQKNRTGIWSFLHYQERWFFFPENMILFFRHKTKDDLSQKKIWKYDIFFKCSEKIVFPKNWRLNMIFFVISGKMVFFFSRKYIFPLGGKWKKMIFIKKRVEIWYFLYICVGVRDVALPLWLKNEDAPKKYTSSVKGVISDDIDPRFILDSSYFCWNTTFIDA